MNAAERLLEPIDLSDLPANQHKRVELGLRARYDLEPGFEPGAEMCYRTFNYDLLGEIVRRVSGAGLDEFGVGAVPLFDELAQALDGGVVDDRIAVAAAFHAGVPQVCCSERCAVHCLFRQRDHLQRRRRSASQVLWAALSLLEIHRPPLPVVGGLVGTSDTFSQGRAS